MNSYNEDYGSAIVPVQAGMVARDGGLGDRSIERSAETSSTAVAEQARAKVQARYLVAMQRPRNMDDVRVRLLRECKRPGFARTARYRKPVGRGVEGPSIRFAEAAVRLMGNIVIESPVTYDDPSKQILCVSVTDLETNATYSLDVTIEKTVERSQVKDGQRTLGMRSNSQGRTTYLVEATEDDLLNKRAALLSKAIRTLSLRLLPGDILEECMETCLATQSQQDAADPDAARKAIADAFAGIGVLPAQLSEYLGHPVAQVTVSELVELRGLFMAIRDGEASWADAMAMKRPAKEGEPQVSAATKNLKDKLEARKVKPATAAQPAPKAEDSRPDFE